MSWWADIWSKKEDISQKRFEYPLFTNKALQQQVAENGFAVLPLLSPDEVAFLHERFFALLELLGEPLPNAHWSSGRVSDVHIRNFAREAIHAVLPKRLSSYFNPETTDFIGGIFVAKKPSNSSRLYPHQDSSHTDETRYPAVYAWVPLVDTTIQNGAMHILKGSHLWGNRYRSLNVPWLYDGYQEMMIPHMTPVPMKAGEVLFFDSAAIHYSTDNLGNSIRPAVNFYIKPREATFLHHYIDHGTPKGMVEVFQVDINFFYNYDFMQRPPCPPYTQLRTLNYNIIKPDLSSMRKYLKSYI